MRHGDKMSSAFFLTRAKSISAWPVTCTIAVIAIVAVFRRWLGPWLSAAVSILKENCDDEVHDQSCGNSGDQQLFQSCGIG
jgi:hypothetical protein